MSKRTERCPFCLGDGEIQIHPKDAPTSCGECKGAGVRPARLNIGLDWDGTVTEDPKFWAAFVHLARQHGHKVHIVTFRKETLENMRECDLPGALTYCTDCAPKDWYMGQKGVDIDIWVDNEPEKVRTGR